MSPSSISTLSAEDKKRTAPQRFAVRAAFSCSKDVSADVRGGNVIQLVPKCVTPSMYRSSSSSWNTSSSVCSMMNDGSLMIYHWNTSSHGAQSPLTSSSGRFAISFARTMSPAVRARSAYVLMFSYAIVAPFLSSRVPSKRPAAFPLHHPPRLPVKGSIIHPVHSRRVDLRLMCFKFLRISATF